MASSLEDPDDDTLRVMVATDTHLGFMERDPVRGTDSFAAFEESLFLAKKYKASKDEQPRERGGKEGNTEHSWLRCTSFGSCAHPPLPRLLALSPLCSHSSLAVSLALSHSLGMLVACFGAD